MISQNQAHTAHTLPYMIRLMEERSLTGLREWGKRIANTDKDPAFALLQQLIFADKQRILANLLTMPKHPAFAYCHAYNSRYDPLRTTHDIIAYINNHNELFDEDGYPYAKKSTALHLWTQYLGGNTAVETSLLYAIAARVWRNMEEINQDFIRGASVYFHAYLFYYLGWNPDTKLYHAGKSAKSESLKYLTGDEIPKNRKKYLTGEAVPEQQCGSLLFNCIPRIHHTHWEECEMAVESRVKFSSMPLLDFGENGIAIYGTWDDEMVGTFLTFPADYEEGADIIWNELMNE